MAEKTLGRATTTNVQIGDVVFGRWSAYADRVIDIAAIKARFEALEPVLDERERRLFAASEARAVGHGGRCGIAGNGDCAQHD